MLNVQYSPPHSVSSRVVTFIITLLPSCATHRVFFVGQDMVFIASEDVVVAVIVVVAVVVVVVGIEVVVVVVVVEETKI